MSLQASVNPPIPKKQPYGPGIGNAARELRASRMAFGDSVAGALESLLQRTDAYEKALRSDGQAVREILVTDATGKVIGAIGEFIFQGVPVTNYFSEIHVGDPLGTGNPSQALFNANSDGSVTVGQNGWLDVLDPYSGDAAWIGTQYDTQAITGAIASPTTPLIRLTIVGHTLATGDVVRVLDVGGVPNATGIRTVTKINANTIDLQSTVFVGPYTSGGTVDRLMHVTGAVNNGSGLIRLTVTAHGYESGDKVNAASVGGVSAATGQWIITVITANTFDLVGSTFAGAYTSGGTCLRYFAGGLFQTIAIGPSFANYKLRAFADGSLKIRNATIVLSDGTATITLNPSVPSFVLDDGGAFQVEISPTVNGVIVRSTGVPQWSNSLQSHSLTIKNRNALLNVSLSSDNTINDGRLSVYDSTGAETFAVLGQGGFFSATGFGTAAGMTLDHGASPADSQLLLQANSLGALSLLSFAADNQQIYFDAERLGSTLTARDDTAARLSKGGDLLKFGRATGLTPGSSFAFTDSAVMDLATGFWRFGDGTTPSYAVDSAGDVNAVGVFRKSGLAGLTTARNAGTSLTINTEPTALKGTPGAGQVQFAAVTSVTLNLTSSGFSGGILTS